MDFYDKQAIKSIILIDRHSKRCFTHQIKIICTDCCKTIDKTHEIVDTTFVSEHFDLDVGVASDFSFSYTRITRARYFSC